MSWWISLVLVGDLIAQAYFRQASWGVENKGVSLGLGQSLGGVLATVTLGIFLLWFIGELIVRKKVQFFLVLIALGGMGNIISRVLWGSIWDYICLPFLPFCFNLSDLMISLGVVSYILRVNGN